MGGKAPQDNQVNITIPDIPMPDVGKAESDYSAMVPVGGTVNVDVHITADGGKDDAPNGVAQSWWDWQEANSTTVVTDLVTSITKLSSILDKYGLKLESIGEISEIADRLKNGYDSKYTPYGMEDTVQKYTKFLEDPKGSADKLIQRMMSAYDDYMFYGGMKYKDSKKAKEIESEMAGFYDMAGAVSGAMKAGDIATAADQLMNMSDQLNKVKVKMSSAARLFAQYDKDPHKWESEQKLQAKSEESKAKAEADKAAADAENAQRKLEKTQKQLNDVQRQATEQQKDADQKLANANKELNRAKEDAAEQARAIGGNPPAGAATPPSGGNGNGGGGIFIDNDGTDNKGSIIKVFKDVDELYTYLESFGDGSEIKGTVGEIKKWLSDLDSDARGITARFSKIGGEEVLDRITLSAVSRELGKGGVSRASFGYSIGDDGKYKLENRNFDTISDIEKGDKYREELARRTEALKAQVQAMLKLPIFDADPAGEKKNPLREQLETIADINHIAENGGIKLIDADSLSALEKSERLMKSIDKSVQSYNQRMSKKMANRGIEQMPENVKDMEAQAKGLEATFKSMGILDKGASAFKEFSDALAAYNQSTGDPNAMIDSYNRMFSAIKELNRVRGEETAILSANNRVKAKAKKIGDENLRVNSIEKTRLSKYQSQYKEMGQKLPQQMKGAKDAIKRFRSAKTDEEREEAYRQINENASWMRDDLKVRYPKYQAREKRNEQMGKQNRRTYRNVTSQNVKLDKTRRELAELAQPYGGLEAQNLPDFLQKAVTALENVKREGNLESRISKIKGLDRLVEIAKERSKQDKSLADANALLSKMNTESPMTVRQAGELQTAIDRVKGLTGDSSANEIADAYANLAAKIKEAAEAQGAFEKAETAANKKGLNESALVGNQMSTYQGYLKQVQSIKKAFADIGQTVDTSEIERLIDIFNYTDAFDSKAMQSARANVGVEMKKLGQQLNFEKSIFSAENKRDNKVQSLNEWIDGLNVNDRQLQKIEELRNAINQLNGINLRAPGQLAEFNKQFDALEKTAHQAEQQVELLKRYRAAIGDNDYGLLGNEHGKQEDREYSTQLKTDLENAYNAFMSDPSSLNNMQALSDALQAVEARLKSISRIDAFGKLSEQADQLKQQVDMLESKNGASATWRPAQQSVYQLYSDTMNEYNNQVNAGNYKGAEEALGKVKNQVNALNESFKSGGGLVGVFDGKMSKLATRLLGIGSGFMAFGKVVNTYKKMVGYVTQIDTAMTELRKVTDETEASYTRFQKQSGKTAIQVGSSIKDLINTTVEYGRMGYSLAESQQLGVVTTKFANTGNFSGVTEASDALISIIRGFDNLDVGDAELISDKLTAVANNYAVTASDIANGLQRSASALNIAGVNVDQATAMITAIAEVTRDAGGAGNAVKVMSMRLRGAKTELEEAGESTDGMAESTSKLRAQVAALTNVNGKGGFDIMQDDDTFKSVYDIMLGISKVWDDMTDVKQSALLELMAGKVRGNQVAALLRNMSRAEEILHTSENAAGTMDEVHARWLDSIAAKQAQLTASWENLSQTVVNSDMVKMFYDSSSGILGFFDQLIGKLGTFGTVFSVAGNAILGKLGNGDTFDGISGIFDFISGRNKDVKVRGEFIKAYNDVFSNTADKQKALVAANNAVGNSMNEAEKFAAKYSEGVIEVGEGADLASMSMEAFGGVVENGMKAFGTGILLMAASYGINALVGLWDQFANAEEYAAQAADDAEAEYKDATAQVQSLEQELANTQKQYDELAAKGPLNFADEQTKNDLREQTEELKLQLELAKQIEAAKGKEAYNTKKESWKEKYSLNQSLPFIASNANMFGGGKTFVENTRGDYYPNMDSWDFRGPQAGQLKRLQGSAEAVGKQIKQYIDKGFIGNDVEGSIAMYDYLTEIRNEASDVLASLSADETTPDEVMKPYRDVIESAESSLDNLKAGLLSVYGELNGEIATMREHGDEATDLFSHMLDLRDMIGESFTPKTHEEQKLLDLRKTNADFDKTYEKLEKLAETTEITSELLNSAEYQGFREQLEANGISVDNLIVKLNELRKAADLSDISTITAAGLAEQINGLLGNRSTGASIMKNTGYGSPISEEDYKKLVDMNDRDYLNAVEYSHGTAFFNQDKFDAIVMQKLGDQYNKMYDDMIVKQDEYVKQTKKMNALLADYYRERNKNVADLSEEEAKAHRDKLKRYQEEMLALSKSMMQTSDDIELYNRLGMQIKNAGTAYAKWQLAHGGPEEGDNYDQALTAYKELEEGYKSGRIGNAAYKAAQEYLLGASGNYYGDKKQRELLKRYLSKSNPDSKEGNDTGWGARNFQKDLISKGILNKDGSLKADWYTEDIATAMGIGTDLVEHLFGELNEFIADEDKKYKLQSKTLEDTAKSEQYDNYIRAKEAYDKATADYATKQDSKSAESLLMAHLDYLKASGEIGVDEYSAAAGEVKAAGDGVVAALTAATGAINALAAVLGMAGLAQKGYKVGAGDNGFYVKGPDGKTLVEGTYDEVLKYVSSMDNTIDGIGADFGALNNAARATGNSLSFDEVNQKYVVTDMYGAQTSYDSKVEAVTALFDKTAKDASTLVKEMNALAASKGIEKQITHDNKDGMWHIGETAYADVTSAISAMFSGYTDKQSALIGDLTNAVIAFTGDNDQNKGIGAKLEASMTASGAAFGQAAMTAWGDYLKKNGIEDELGINENGKITVGEAEYENIAAALSAVLGDFLKDKPDEGMNAINETIRAYGSATKAEYKDGQYVLTAADGNIQSFSTATEAMAAVANDGVQALQTTYADLNATLAQIGSDFRTSLEQGKATITDTATGEKQQFSDLATGFETAVSTAYSDLSSTVDSLSGTLSKIQNITLKVEADGKITLVDQNGKAMLDASGNTQSFDSLSTALQVALPESLSGLDTSLKGLNEVLGGLKINKDGVINDLSEELRPAIAQSVAEITAAQMAQMLGGVGIGANGKKIFNGKSYDTFAQIIQDQFSASSIKSALDQNAGAFNENQGAVEGATAALGGFSAALAAATLTKMLEQTGKGGYVTPGENNELVYHGKSGVLSGIFTDLEDAYKHIFPEYGKWQFAQDENGQWTATKKNENITDASKLIDGLDTYTEAIGELTKVTIDQQGNGYVNENYGFEGGSFNIQDGKLTVNANGTNLELGDIESIQSDGINSVFTTKSGATVQAPGAYAKGVNGDIIERPDMTKTARILHKAASGVIESGDVSTVKELLEYAQASGSGADKQAKELVNTVRKVIDQDPTGRLYDTFSDFVDAFDFTDTARQNEIKKQEEEARQRIEQQRAAEEEAARKAAEEEAARRAAEEQAAAEEEARQKAEAQKRATYNASQIKKMRDAEDNLSESEVDGIIDRMYDVSALAKEFNGNPDNIADFLMNLASIEDIIRAEKYRKQNGEDYEEARDAVRAAEAERQAAEEKARAEAEAARRAEREAQSAPYADAINSTVEYASEFAGQLAQDIKEATTVVDENGNETTPSSVVSDISNGIANAIAAPYDALDKTVTALYDLVTKDAPEKEKQKDETKQPEHGTLTATRGMEYYQRGNVDLYNRNLIPTKALEYAGWEIDGDGIATMFSSNYQGKIDGEDYILHITPILPDGSVLSPDELDGYVTWLFDQRDQTGQNIMTLDNPQNNLGGLGIVTWLQQIIGDLNEAQKVADEFDKGLSKTQADYYDTESIRSIFDALENLPDIPDYDYNQAFMDAIEHAKDMYDFDKVRQNIPWLTGENDTTVARALYNMGNKADEYKKQEPQEQELEVDVKYNDPGFNPPRGTKIVDVQYNDPKANTNKTAGKGGETYTMNAKGTSNSEAGTSLVDEEGAELIEHISRGTFELGTDSGPRFTQLDKGDVVHTAEETKKIKRRGLIAHTFEAFRNGGVKSGGAYSIGSFLGGLVDTVKSWFTPSSSSSSKTTTTTITQTTGSTGGTLVTNGSGSTLAGSNYTNTNKNKSGGGTGKGIKNALKWAESLVDWIPTALELLKKKTTDYIKSAEKNLGYLAKNSDLTNAIENVRKEIDLNQRAVDRYKRQADEFATRAGLSGDIIQKIQQGTINIEEYDENTRKAIQTYQTWWDKAKGCEQTIEELNDQLYDLSKQKLDNITTYFGNINDLLEQQIETYNNMVKVKEEYGEEMTRADYLDAINLTQKAIENLSAEQKALQDELDYQVTSGVIKVGSDDWYNYAKQIEELNSTIADAKINLSDLNDEVKNITLNNLKTSIYYLDNLQNKIEGIQRLREAQSDINSDINSYRALISTGMRQIENIEMQNAQLREQMVGLDVLSEKYQELYQELQDNEDKILDIKTSQEEWNDAILDMKISVLEKQNEKYQQQMALMKALNELEDARQRKVLLYDNEDGFKYVADQDALESAQDTVNDQIHDLIIRGLEEQKNQNNIYDNMGNQLIPVTDMLAGIDFSKYYDSINRGSETSSLLTNLLSNIDIPEILSRTTGGDVSIDIGDIILNGVNDAQSLGDAIIAQLPGYLVQAIYAKGS